MSDARDGNLLVILSDEHQARAMGAAGHPVVRTPELDALAARGLRFTDAYTPSPICVPARAAFATGRHVHRTGHWDNAMPYTGEPPGWGHALQRAGIAVESIGKLHYRDASDPAGFDAEHLPMMVADGVGMVWASIRDERARVKRPGRMLGDRIGPGRSPYTDYDEAVTERAVEWLHARAEAPGGRWCLLVGLVAPHFPLVVPERFYAMYPAEHLPPAKLHPSTGYRRHPWVEKQNAFNDSDAAFVDAEERLAAIASYYGLCSWLDHNVGRILDALDASGLADNTTVAYTSDHGDNVGARGLWGKSNLYEEAAAVPLILAGRGVAPGSVCATPVSLVDLSATIAAHFGVALPGDADGRDLLVIASEPHDPTRVVFSEYHAAGSVSGAFMIRRGHWKYIHYVGFEPELFDLRADPEETTDLADTTRHARTLADLHAELEKICDPRVTDARAHADQRALVARHGGLEAAARLGAPGATPPPAPVR